MAILLSENDSSVMEPTDATLTVHDSHQPFGNELTHTLMDSSTVFEKLTSALDRLIRQDSYLFFNNANERSLCARLAMYLQEEFSTYTVDCEYNRNITENDLIKRLRSYKLLELLDKHVSADDTDGVTVYPDIIVHKRGETDNLLIIEAKKSTSNINHQIDKEKLKAYKQQLGYTFARFIVFGTNGEPSLIVQNVEIK